MLMSNLQWYASLEIDMIGDSSKYNINQRNVWLVSCINNIINYVNNNNNINTNNMNLNKT